MSLYKNRIVITGGTGRFGLELRKIKNKYKLFFPSKKELNILEIKNSIQESIDKSGVNIIEVKTVINDNISSRRDFLNKVKRLISTS